EPWQRLAGGTLSLQISPDGTKLLARRDPKRGESFLAVWPLEETVRERESEERRRRREAENLRDPNEVADRPEVPRPRAPKWRLPTMNGFAAGNPRWMPDGESVLFTRRAPDSDGVLRLDLFSWRLPDGSVRRVTRLADVVEADPAWSADGSRLDVAADREGIWNLESADVSGGASSALLTRVTGGALAPAPSPDGKALFFLEITARGVDVRRLALPASGLAPLGH